MLKKILSFKKNRFGILSLNARNGEYININNQRKHYPSVDNKLITKQLASLKQIPIPPTYHVIKSNYDLNNIKNIFDKYDEFVIKPANGSGGNGILVITGKYENYFQKSNKILITEEDLIYHISNILSGMYSLGSHQDYALIEYKIRSSEIFNDISAIGVPDIRVIVYKKIPAMAMLRLPTNVSDGKANLHQGALGVGINLSNGMLKGGVFKKRLISYHPDTLKKYENFFIPNWDDILLLSRRCGFLTDLNYIGVDIVIDKDKGPLVLELNARPGLSIQIANRQGLLGSLKKIDEFIENNKDSVHDDSIILDWCKKIDL